MIVNPEKFDVLLCNICPFRLLLQFICETSYAGGLKQMQLATEYPSTIKRSQS